MSSFLSLALVAGFALNPSGLSATLLLDPVIEGIYSIRLTCDSNPRDCNPVLKAEVDRISIVDTHGPMGVWVSVASKNHGDVLDTFTGAVVGPDSTAQITATPIPGVLLPSRFSYLSLETDRVSGNVQGALIDVRTAGIYQFHGKSLHRVADTLSDGASEPGTQLASFIGRYRGSVAGLAGTLIIMERPDHKLIGSFSSTDSNGGMPDVVLQFDNTSWNQDLGLLQMVFFNRRFRTAGALDLRIVRGSRGQQLQGIYFTGFQGGEASFRRM